VYEREVVVGRFKSEQEGKIMRQHKKSDLIAAIATRLSFFFVVDLITSVCRVLLLAVPILTSCVNMVQYHRLINHHGILYQWRPSSSLIMGHAELPMVTMQNHLSRLHDELNLAVRQKKDISN
jgi:hypothetical protein